MPPVASSSAPSHSHRRRHRRRSTSSSASTSQFRNKVSLALLGLLLLALVGSLGVIGYTATQGEPPQAVTLDEARSPSLSMRTAPPADTTPGAKEAVVMPKK